MTQRIATAMPHSTAANRRRAVRCPKCGAASQEKCRRWISESTYGRGGSDTDGEGRWQYLKTFHAERRAS